MRNFEVDVLEVMNPNAADNNAVPLSQFRRRSHKPTIIQRRGNRGLAPILFDKVLEIFGGYLDFADLAALADGLHCLGIELEVQASGISNDEIERSIGIEVTGHARLEDFTWRDVGSIRIYFDPRLISRLDVECNGAGRRGNRIRFSRGGNG